MWTLRILGSAFILVSIVVSTPALSTDTLPNNLILRIWGGDNKLLKSRILGAARAVGPNGKLILDYTTKENLKGALHPGEYTLDVSPEELVNSLPKNLRSRIFLVNSAEPYAWPRDTSFGWRTMPNGRRQLLGRAIGNAMGGKPGTEGAYTSYSSMGIATLLMACEGENFEFPYFGKESGQGGEIVGNGQGTCVLNSEMLENANDFLEKLGCKIQVKGNSIMDWRKRLWHFNGHIDLSAVFVGPRTVMIPKVTESCTTAFSNEWHQLKQSLVEKKLDVIEIPVAGGCDVKSNEAPEGQPGSRFVRSYSNAAILSDAILIPEFKGFDKDNKIVKQELKRAMRAGRIPRKKIISIPSPEGGGEVRCMSLEVPGQLGTCSQEKLDKVIESQIHKANAVADSGDCNEISTSLSAIRFLIGEPARQRSMTTPNGRKIQMPETFSEKLKVVAKKLETSLGKCSANTKAVTVK